MPSISREYFDWHTMAILLLESSNPLRLPRTTIEMPSDWTGARTWRRSGSGSKSRVSHLYVYVAHEFQIFFQHGRRHAALIECGAQRGGNGPQDTTCGVLCMNNIPQHLTNWANEGQTWRPKNSKMQNLIFKQFLLEKKEMSPNW